jgi:hypothetical protein
MKDYKLLYEKAKELNDKLTELLVHVGLPGEYKPRYDLIKELSKVECHTCKEFASELTLLTKELRFLEGNNDKVFIEISPSKDQKVCGNCEYFYQWGVVNGQCLRPKLRGNNNRTETQTCRYFKFSLK